MFDVRARGDCDPFREEDDPSIAASPLHRVYVIPSDQDTIFAYSSLFDRARVEAVTGPLIASIHFLE